LQFKDIQGKQFRRPYLEKIHHKKRPGGVARDVDLSSNPSTAKKKKKGVKVVLTEGVTISLIDQKKRKFGRKLTFMVVFDSQYIQGN
jgi:hypothetical protein